MWATLRPCERSAMYAGAMLFGVAAPLCFAGLVSLQPLSPQALLNAIVGAFVIAGTPCATVTTMMLLVASLHRDDTARGRPCAFCGYDLTGAPSDCCPECGSREGVADPRMLWKS